MDKFKTHYSIIRRQDFSKKLCWEFKYSPWGAGNQNIGFIGWPVSARDEICFSFYYRGYLFGLVEKFAEKGESLYGAFLKEFSIKNNRTDCLLTLFLFNGEREL